jgi:hypothetical protein
MYRRAIKIERAGQIHRVVLDGTTVGRALTDMADLRIDFNGTEVPHAARQLTGSTRETVLRPQVMNKGFVPGAGTRLTLDIGGIGKHSRLRIASTESNYRRRVQIETSADSRSWSIVRRDGYVLNFEHDQRRITAHEVDYPVSTHRYVRATFADWLKPETLTDVTLLLHETIPAQVVTIATAVPVPKPDIAARSMEYMLDLGTATSFDRVRVEVEDREFHRAARFLISADGRAWRYAADGFLSRIGDQSQLTLQGGNERARHIKLIIFHQDDRPIRIAKVHLEAPAGEVQFLPQERGLYWLCYGNPQARRPTYDLPILIDRREGGGVEAVALGAEKRNPDYQPRTPVIPWTERHPAILYGTLAAAVSALGYVTVRFFLKLRGTEA